jgi:hypothetical protein
MPSHDVVWAQPPALLDSPTAGVIATARDVRATPAILRFTRDSFMDEFLAVLDTRPEDLRDYLVRRETWRGFWAPPLPEPRTAPSMVLRRLGLIRRRIPALTAGATTISQTAIDAGIAAAAVRPTAPLKLYQPAHQRHYLITCSLVCRVVGLPDRAVEAGRGEQVGCVIRRLLPPASRPDVPVEEWEEHAWVAQKQAHVWRRVGASAEQMLSDEELLPMFAVHFSENERRKRRLFAGVIPVGKREAYLGAPKAESATATPGVTPRTARKIMLRKEVIEPWKALVRRAQDVNRTFVGPFIGDNKAPGGADRQAKVKIEREQIQTVSWFILLDFARFLATHVKPVWRAVLDPAAVARLSIPETELFMALRRSRVKLRLRRRLRKDGELDDSGNELYDLNRVTSSLRSALAMYGTKPEGINAAFEQQLDAVEQPYDRQKSDSRALWPTFLFPLADPDLPDDAPLPPTPSTPLDASEREELTLDENPLPDDPLERLDKLAVLVVRALRDDPTQAAPEPAVPAAAIPPANPLDGWFVIRCVYQRPACEPIHGCVMSERTERFQMAGFFDPDAPARPIRIGLPIDTSPAGLRKFDKNTAFVISDTLCGQIRRMRGVSLADLVLSLLPWPLHKDLPGDDGGPCKTATDPALSLGMICSMSIPIITICALLLLMIMVSILDMVFRWMPYFNVCFPLPGLKGKPPLPAPPQP